MLHECVGIEPDFLSLSSMAVRKNFLLILKRHLLPPSNAVKFTSLMGLGAFLVMETKEAAILLGQIRMKNFGGGTPFLAMEETSLSEILCPNSRL